MSTKNWGSPILRKTCTQDKWNKQKIKNKNNRIKQQKNFNGAQFTESLDNSPTKTLAFHKERQMVDLTNDNEEEIQPDFSNTQKFPPSNQRRRGQQTQQKPYHSPPLKKSAIQWNASEVKQYNPAFPAATPCTQHSPKPILLHIWI